MLLRFLACAGIAQAIQDDFRFDADEALMLIQLRAGHDALEAEHLDRQNPEGTVPDPLVGADLQCGRGSTWLSGGERRGLTTRECRQFCDGNPNCDYYGSWPAEENNGAARGARGTCRIWMASRCTNPIAINVRRGYSNYLYQIERPTTAPPTEAPPADTASAVGDPHITTVGGNKMDLVAFAQEDEHLDRQNPEGTVPDPLVGADLQCGRGSTWLSGGERRGLTTRECRQFCDGNPNCDYYGSWPAEENNGAARGARGTCRIWMASRCTNPIAINVRRGYSNYLYQIERPTTAPPTEAPPADTASAVGDPHITTVGGNKMDLQ